MNIIKNYYYSKNGSNTDVINKIKPNEAIIVCNNYIMEQLSREGVTFNEMYPGVFIITSIKGNPTLQDIEKINRIIRLYNPDLLDDSDLVAQMSQEKMDNFFQNYYWSEKEKKTMHIIKVEYRDKSFDFNQGSLIVTYQAGKKGRELSFDFGDGRTQLLGYTKNNIRIEDVWDKYLFDETVKPWLEKNKLNLSLKVHNSSIALNNENEQKVVRPLELEEK